MTSPTQEIVKFSLETEYKNLPRAVVQKVKNILLDTMGCALAGMLVNKGRYSIEFAKTLGGPPQATVVGVGNMVSCAAAAFANGELISAMEYDPVLLPPGHVSSCVVASHLAMAEYIGSSGQNLINALAIAHEVSARLGRSLSGWHKFVKESPKKGKVVLAPAHGSGGYPAIGGAAGLAKMMKLERENTFYALGLAGYFAPMPTTVKFYTTLPHALTKACSSGWVSLVQIASVQLAQQGYVGDSTVLDGEHGFWKMSGSEKWEPEIITDKLGESWCFLETEYKRYPCSYAVHSALDAFIELISEKDLSLKDIEETRVFIDPVVEVVPWGNNDIKTHIDAQFSIPYVFAVAANGIRKPHWEDPKFMSDPEIMEFMKKVRPQAHPVFSEKKIENPKSQLGAIEVVTKKETFRREKEYSQSLTDTELLDKFRENASQVLPSKKIDNFIKCIQGLEKMENLTKLIDNLRS